MNPVPANKREGNQFRARLSQIERLLGSNPALADQLAAALLGEYPDHPAVLLYQGIAHRLLKNPAAAIDILQHLSERHPNAPMVYLHLGLALREHNQNEGAIRALRHAVEVKGDFADAWLALADLLVAMGDRDAADQAFTTYADHVAGDPRLQESVKALQGERYIDAETQLRNLIAVYPNDIVALCMLAEAIEHQGQVMESEALLKRCLKLAPGFNRARHSFAVILMRHNRMPEAILESERLLAAEPNNPDFRKLRAVIHVKLRKYRDAADIYRVLLDEFPNQDELWISLGHVLISMGLRNECIDAYRKAIAVNPQNGEAYWSIANIKNELFSDTELDAMRTQVENPRLADRSRIHFHFALAKAMEDRAEYAESFRHYELGNGLNRTLNIYDANVISKYVQRCKTVFTEEFFAARSGCGSEIADPIFILGLPRSGSTLVEQILASHSLVEGTTELPEIMALGTSLGNWDMGNGRRGYPEILTEIAVERYRELGDAYIEQTRIQRKLETPFFIDKMPENFAHTGLIHLLLPNARIIDVRRHPMACGFAIYKQLFARHRSFSYDLQDIGRYYRDYVELMAHFDRVLPGRVHRICYEALIDDTEGEVRRLLEYCGLDFEGSCLEFYNNRRAVSTPSAEQVRSAIYRSGMDYWLNFEPWLGPLSQTIGNLPESNP